MSVGLVLEFQGVGVEQYEKVNEKLGFNTQKGTGDWPKGLEQHIGGTNDAAGLFVIEVWDSRESQEAFMNERLGAALAEVGVEPPVRMTWIEIQGNVTP